MEWKPLPDSVGLYQKVKHYEVHAITMDDINRIILYKLPEKKILEVADVKGSSIEDGFRAMKLADQLVKQIKKATDAPASKISDK